MYCWAHCARVEHDSLLQKVVMLLFVLVSYLDMTSSAHDSSVAYLATTSSAQESSVSYLATTSPARESSVSYLATTSPAPDTLPECRNRTDVKDHRPLSGATALPLYAFIVNYRGYYRKRIIEGEKQKSVYVGALWFNVVGVPRGVWLCLINQDQLYGTCLKMCRISHNLK